MTVVTWDEERWTPALERKVILRDNAADRQVWKDVFEDGYHVPPEMPTPSTVLDLGSNIGLTAAYYRTLWPMAEIVCVEMSSANAAIGVLNAPGCLHFNMAVSADGGPGTYDPLADYQCHQFAAGPGPDGSSAVPSMTVAQICQRLLSGATADFVKMDVEGEEWPIMRRAQEWRPFVKHLLVEIHGERWPAPELVSEAVALLEAGGFSAVPHTGHPCAVWATAR